MRRTSKEIDMSNDICNIWLRLYENNPNKAWIGFLKMSMEWNIDFPYFIEGLSDFIRCSKVNSNNPFFVCEQRNFDLNE